MRDGRSGAAIGQLADIRDGSSHFQTAVELLDGLVSTTVEVECQKQASVERLVWCLSEAHQANQLDVESFNLIYLLENIGNGPHCVVIL